MSQESKIQIWVSVIAVVITIILSIVGTTVAYNITDAGWKGTIEERLNANGEIDKIREQKTLEAIKELTLTIKELSTEVHKLSKHSKVIRIFLRKELKTKYGIDYDKGDFD